MIDVAGDAMTDDASPAAPDAFEHALLDAIAAATPHADALRAQARRAAVVRRDQAADGRTTYLCVAADTPRLADGELSRSIRLTLADAADVSGVAELTVHNGWLDSLSVSVTGGPFPADPRLGDVTA